jgi:hypothetical protein
MFESARLKIDRAKHHVRDLRRTLGGYSNTAVVEFQPDGSCITVKIDIRAEPTCSLIIGDAAHNLRSALDHAFWELMGIDGDAQNRFTAFPVHAGKRVDYEASCKGKITKREDTLKFFIGLAAYPDGIGNILAQIHSFDSIDKHSLLNPVMGVTSLSDCVIVRPDGTREVWSISDIGYGDTIIRFDGTAAIRPFGEGGFELNNDTKATFDVLFGEPDFVELKGVVPTLNIFCAEVSRTVDDMERLVLSRT